MITPRFSAVLAALGAVLVLGTTSPAAAQPPTYELSAGYQFTHITDQSFPIGFAVDAARNWGNLGLVAEGGWAFDSGSDEFDVDESFTLWHLAAGARVSGRQNPRVTPFGQILAGWLQARANVEVAGIDISDSTNHFMFQPGGGVSFQAGDGWSIVGSIDYRRVFIDEDDDDGSGENQFRIFFGARMLLD
ncbi:MAG TPA: outer membrane beta-barrel protein [Vicinamibacterales bacterium]|nr:outer membrane beta-barrel protein [Vicinamibacterales bacterium]